MVERTDVDEALRLMECSKESLVDEEDREPDMDKSVLSKIYRIIKDMSGPGAERQRPRAQRRLGKGPGGERDMDVDSDEEQQDEKVLSMVDIRARVLSAGFTEAQLVETLNKVGFSPSFGEITDSSFYLVREYRCPGSHRWWIQNSTHVMYRFN